MGSWQELRKNLLKEYYPSEKEIDRVSQVYSRVSGRIEELSDLDTELVGSSSRNTFVSGLGDIDIFLMFPHEVESSKLEEEGVRVGKEVFESFGAEHHVEYSEHPYVQGRLDGVDVEVVPCHDVEKGRVKSSVDRSPHHARWMRDNLTEQQREDVVLLKQMLDSAGLYGSSLKTRGFSGYLCELLVHHYGGLRSLLQNSRDWSRNMRVDPAEVDTGHEFESGFVVIDPVDPERNVAAVLSEDNLARFMLLASDFETDPSIRFFEEPDRQPDRLAVKKEIERRREVLALELDVPDKPEDVLYPQMRRLQSKLVSTLEDEDFRVFESGFHLNEKARLVVEVDPGRTGVENQRGPSVFHDSDHVEAFRNTHDDLYVEDARLMARRGRELTDVRQVIKEFTESDSNGVPDGLDSRLRRMCFVDPKSGGEDWFKFLEELFHLENRWEK
nr:MAG: CCA-adding enzyme [Candidatus Nanosalinarum sp. J07AB56]